MRCGRKDCDNDAYFQIGFLLYAAAVAYGGGPEIPAQARAGLYVCQECRPLVTIEELVTDDGGAMICRGFEAAGKAAPVREKTRIEFFPPYLWVDPEGKRIQ